MLEALQGLDWQPTLLGYANHLHDNDRWPMGDAGDGIALPPAFDRPVPMQPYCLPLSLAQQRDKAMALGMMHDLQPPAPFKRRVRRVDSAVAGRSGAVAVWRKRIFSQGGQAPGVVLAARTPGE